MVLRAMHPEVESSPRASTVRDLLAWAALCAVTLLAYGPALQGGFLWDDTAHVTKAALRSAHGLWLIWSKLGATQQYYPVVFSAFWLEHRLWGDAPLGYHLVNGLLHATSAWIFALILRRLGESPNPTDSISSSTNRVGAKPITRRAHDSPPRRSSPGPRLRPGAAWLAALLFALHPVCVESVAWISEQKNTLSALFYLLAAWVYVRFDERPSGRNPALWIAATSLFILALFSKTVTATLPAGLLVVGWWRRGKVSWRRDGVPLVPWFALALCAGLLTAWVERTYIGAQGAAFDLSPVERCLLAARIVWFYAGKLAWPSPLIFIYPRWDVHSDSAQWIGYLAGILGVTAGLGMICRRRRGPLAAWLFFVGTLFPALGFFNVYPFVFSYVADHFQYLASLGLFAAAAAGAAALASGAPPAAKAAIGVACGAVLATLGAATQSRSRIYRDLPTLYEATLGQNPSTWMAHNNLGVWYSDHGDAARALPHYLEALRLKPDYAEAHYNLGTLRFKEPGRLAEAIAEFREALRLKPDYPEAHNNLGDALFSVPGRLEEAIVEYREALREEPDFAEAHNNLGQALARLPGRLQDAILQYEEALRLKPAYAEALNNLGTAWSATPGHVDDAIARFKEVLRINPNSAAVHYNLGNAYSKKPDGLGAAIAEYEAAVRLNPNFAEAHHNLGNALAKIPGRLEEAMDHYREAVRLKPELAPPR